ncbi:MAG: sulfur oxidation c-type cytochrome SoxA [Betaproteobacteria bacterium]|nr:MAG: sulfur oxidation c-type cytochrome SoxA [Betaproteobacteria bacterium]
MWIQWILALVLSAGAVAAEPVYRERVADEGLIVPRASGDSALSGTYRYWKNPAKLDARLIGDPENNWKLNWVFLDGPFNTDMHAGHLALDRGTKLFRELNTSGTFKNCLTGSGLGIRKDFDRLRGLRTVFPRYRTDLNRVAGLEEVIEHCARLERQELQMGSHDNSAVSMFIASYSNGMPIAIDVSGGEMKKSYERGKQLFFTKMGRLNLACASCHVNKVGAFMRATAITSPYADADHYPVYRDRTGITSLQLRFAQCSLVLGINPLKMGSRSYTDLEVFFTALTNGHPVSVPSERY